MMTLPPGIDTAAFVASYTDILVPLVQAAAIILAGIIVLKVLRRG